MLEQLRAMALIMSEVFDPSDAPGRQCRQRREQGHMEDFLSAPMANLRIRTGGSADGLVETYQFRRASGSRVDGERSSGHQMEVLLVTLSHL